MAPSRALLRSVKRMAVSHGRIPIAPSLVTVRTNATSTTSPSSPSIPRDSATDTSSSFSSPPPRESKRLKPLSPAQRAYLSSLLRVNQAGELAATLIYQAQTPVVLRREPHLRPLMQHMYDQEAGHLQTFNSLIAKHRVRPTALYPLWSVMASGLGWGTAMLGKEAAMACTEAVETEIGNHYNAQIRTLLEMVSEWEAEGYDVDEEFRELISTLRRIRDEELEHLDHAIEHDAQQAEPHWLLTGVIRAGCRGAIWVSERV